MTIESVLPWHDGLDLFAYLVPEEAAQAYARQLIDEGKAAPEHELDLIAGLTRAALYYHYGKRIRDGIDSNKENAAELRKGGHDDLADSLKTAGRGNPDKRKKYERYGLIWVMASVWEYIGGNVGTVGRCKGEFRENYTYDASTEYLSPFQKFVNGWLNIIDPAAPFPARKAYRQAIEAWREKY